MPINDRKLVAADRSLQCIASRASRPEFERYRYDAGFATGVIVGGIGLTAPPIGLNVFVVAAKARDVTLTRIYRAVLPFIAADILRLGLAMAFPALALATVRLLT